MQKLYCYVDEAGQHTEGKLFVVTVILAAGESERDSYRRILEQAEQLSGKRRQKWRHSKHSERLAYLRILLSNPGFTGKVIVSVHQNSRAYADLTIISIAKAVDHYTQKPYKATILIDGLRQSERQHVAVLLRRRGVKTDKVRGLNDEKDAFIRFADAVCGCVIDALEGDREYQRLLDEAKKHGVVREYQ